MARDSVRGRLFGDWQPQLLVGRYSVLERVGAGGVGSVYAAYDPELDRKVAIKLLHPGRESESQRRRLVREAQAMARLSHPNVVAVHDVGTFEGRVFMAMEFIDGLTIGRWLAQHEPSWREILRLFAQAGRGLAAAHREGLVHRDFKPDNALVDRRGRVKVTDFGLVRPIGPSTSDDDPARTTGDDETGSRPTVPFDTPLTAEGATMGTPKFMSPEQHDGAVVDARSDQFSFCVALYEALYGCPPFAARTRLELAELVSRGEITPPPRNHAVPRFVEAVLRRGLSVQPVDRWPSMEALLAALERDPAKRRRRAGLGLLAGGLVLAAGWVGTRELETRREALERDRLALRQICEGAGEELSKVWSDERRAGIEAAMSKTGLGFAASTWALVDERLQGFAAAWIEARTSACEQHQRGLLSTDAYDRRSECLALRVDELDTLLGVLERSDELVLPRATQAAAGLTPPAACEDPERLAAARPMPSDPGQVTLVAEQRRRLARAQGLFLAGQFEAAREVAEQAREVAEQELGLDWFSARAILRVGLLEDSLGHPEPARERLERAYLLGLGAGEDRIALEAAAMLARLALDRADDAAFDRWIQQAEAMATRVDDPRQWARVHTVQGIWTIRKGDYRGALSYFERARDAYEIEPESSLQLLADAHQNVGAALYYLGRHEEAGASMARALVWLESLYGEAHPNLNHSLHNLGNVAMARNALDEAERYFRRELEIAQAAFGPEHRRLINALEGLGIIEVKRSRYPEAQGLFERALAIGEQAHGSDNPALVSILINLAIAHLEQGTFAEGKRHGERARQIVTSTRGPDHPELMSVLSGLGNLRLESGEVDQAVAVLERAVAIGEASLGRDHPNMALYYGNLGNALRARGRRVEAIERLRQAAAVLAAAEAPPGLNDGQLSLMLARALLEHGEHAEAGREAERALENLLQVDGPARNLGEARSLLAQALDADPASRGRVPALLEQARADLRRAMPHPVVAQELEALERWAAAR